MSADPAGTVDGTNLFAYVRGSPVVMSDPSGMQAGCCSTPDRAAIFLEQALSIKGLKLRRRPLDLVRKADVTIDRSSINRDDPAAAKTEDGKVTVSGALADTVYDNARKVESGEASLGKIEQFAKSMGVLFHEATHLDLTPSERPGWYEKEVSKFEQATNKYGVSPGSRDQAERLVDEAVGQYVEGAVENYFDTLGQLRRLEKKGTLDSESLNKLREAYNKEAKENRSETHGYWEVPSQSRPTDTKMFNESTRLSPDAIRYADEFTGLSGDFDKDFRPQLKELKQPEPPEPPPAPKPPSSARPRERR